MEAMQKLFEGWSWGNFIIKNVVNNKMTKIGTRSKNKRDDSYLIGIKLTGEASIDYRGYSIDYSANTAIFLPKESEPNMDYYTDTVKAGSAICVLFDSDVPLSTEPQILKNLDFSAKSAAQKLLNVYNFQDKYSYPEMMAAFFELLSILNKASVSDESRKIKSKFDAALGYIDAHLFDSYIDIKHLAKISGATEKYFRNSFKKHFGISPLAYINRIKVNRIRALISNGELSVRDVAKMSGFSDMNYFSRFFKKHFGISPTEYRNRYCGML